MPAFEEIRIIGEGTEGIAHLLRRYTDGALVVRKTSKRPYKRNHIHDLPREVEVLESLGDHPRLVNLLYYNILPATEFITWTTLITYCSYHSGGDLATYIDPEGLTPESFIWHVFFQMAEALAYLHHGYIPGRPWPPHNWQHVVHRDVKPSNIFLHSPRTRSNPFPSLVLGDFGHATFAERSEDLAGTAVFQGPECPQTAACSDIWALGATIHQMAHGRYPLDPIPVGFGGGMERWARMPEARNLRTLPCGYSRVLEGCMMRCLEMKAGERITSLELMALIGRVRLGC